MSIISIIYLIDLEEKKLCFLAKTTGLRTSIPSTYILFPTKLQKRANPVKWICPIEKTISQKY